MFSVRTSPVSRLFFNLHSAQELSRPQHSVMGPNLPHNLQLLIQLSQERVHDQGKGSKHKSFCVKSIFNRKLMKILTLWDWISRQWCISNGLFSQNGSSHQLDGYHSLSWTLNCSHNSSLLIHFLVKILIALFLAIFSFIPQEWKM